jgi:glutathione S-transferase
MMVPVVSRFIAPESERQNWGARWALGCIERRLMLVREQLARAPYMAGDRFTAADISVTYALNLGSRNAGIVLGDAEQAYVARTTGRDAYKRAMDRSHEGVATA